VRKDRRTAVKVEAKAGVFPLKTTKTPTQITLKMGILIIILVISFGVIIITIILSPETSL